VPGALDKAALANHLVRMQQTVGPVTISDALHAGKVIGRKDGLVNDQRPEVRHMQADVVDNFLCHLVPQLASPAFFRFAGEVKAVGTGDMVARRCQATVHYRWHLEGQRYVLR